MEIIYSIWTLFYNIIAEHIDAPVPSWHEFDSYVTVEIGLLHSRTAMYISSSLQHWRSPKRYLGGPNR